MTTSNKNQKVTREMIPDQNPIDGSPLAKPELSKKEAKTENSNRKTKNKVDKESEWKI